MKSRTCSRWQAGWGDWLWALLALLCILGQVGCQVTAEKIQIWKESQNGAPKIRAAVRDTDQPTEIRIQAAHALAELGHYQPLQQDLEALGASDRKTITEGLVGRLFSQMEGSGDQQTTRLQEQAKDALFSLRGAIELEQRRTVEDRLLRWLLADWSRRRAGDHSGEKIVRAIGVRAASSVAERTSDDPRLAATFAGLVAEIGSQADRRVATQKLVALAREQKGRDESTITAIALQKTPAGRDYLAEVGTDGSRPLEERLVHLLALARCADDTVLARMARLAIDRSQPDELRDAAMRVFDGTGSDVGLSLLAGILAGPEQVLRYRAAEAMMACCGARGLAKLLQSLSSRYTYARQDVEDYIEKDARQLGQSALEPLRAGLMSTSWVARVVAVRLLGAMGTREDLVRLEALVGDRTRLPGWNATLGSETALAVQRLKKRLSNG